ncbi:hypothetical protein KFL_003050030 [Klebsormidium nitens]|uniref:Uncharacterized protein n=1 Tax=Klebsormidium nitens TaxID=105231 RepID=A0A1Y1IC69_KLENI|nr:hypothetical protein KFL_003050030 [Klebsormidium nitens]|eukprot:GAQ86691.1 hypothetical protein KFL_003050030 [Klebsormidium nitens]
MEMPSSFGNAGGTKTKVLSATRTMECPSPCHVVVYFITTLAWENLLDLYQSIHWTNLNLGFGKFLSLRLRRLFRLLGRKWIWTVQHSTQRSYLVVLH